MHKIGSAVNSDSGLLTAFCEGVFLGLGGGGDGERNGALLRAVPSN